MAGASADGISGGGAIVRHRAGRCRNLVDDRRKRAPGIWRPRTPARASRAGVGERWNLRRGHARSVVARDGPRGHVGGDKRVGFVGGQWAGSRGSFPWAYASRRTSPARGAQDTEPGSGRRRIAGFGACRRGAPPGPRTHRVTAARAPSVSGGAPGLAHDSRGGLPPAAICPEMGKGGPKPPRVRRVTTIGRSAVRTYWMRGGIFGLRCGRLSFSAPNEFATPTGCG